MKKTMTLVGTSLVLLGLLAGCGASNSKEKVSNQVEQAADSSAVVQSDKTTKSKNDNKGIKEVKVSVTDAIEVYQAKYPNTDITSIELESDFGKYRYQVEGVDDNTEYSLKVDATSKEVSKEKTEKLDRDEQNGVKRKEEKLDLAELKSLEEITEIAEKEAGAGTAIEWNMDSDLGVTFWEVKVKDGHHEVDVKVNAKTGEFLSKEVED